MTAENGQHEAVPGVFWASATPERSCDGVLTLGSGGASLSVRGRIFDERATVHKTCPGGGHSTTRTGNADDIVADFQPQTIHGRTADGRKLTLLEAQGGYSMTGQQFGVQYVFDGEHVDGMHNLFHSIRFRIDGPYWGTTVDSFEYALLADGGEICSYEDDLGRWFEFVPTEALTITEFDRRVLTPCITLTTLATGEAAAVTDRWVRLGLGLEWCALLAPAESVERGRRPLIRPELLSIAKFAGWIDQSNELDGLDAAAADELDGAIQTQVLVLSAVAEGLHRRLYPETPRVASLTKSKSDKVCRIARKSAISDLESAEFSAVDKAEFGLAMREALAHVNDQTFVSRLSALHLEAEAAVPGIAEPFASWPKSVAFARNALAHQDTIHARPTDEFLDLLVALTCSLPWVLRTVLLARAGFDAATLRQCYGHSSAYQFHLANVRSILCDNPHGRPNAPA